MKNLLALVLLTTTFNLSAKNITTQEFAKNFKDYDACFMIYDVKAKKVVSEYNPHNRCSQRIAANSTFKVPLSLMAFDDGLIKQDTTFKWNGEKCFLDTHERDHTPATWMQHSVVWVSQLLAPQLGADKMKHYLAAFQYGNQDMSGDPGKNNGLTHSWLGSSLQISGKEQLNFLNGMLNNTLPISQDAINYTKQNMYLGKLENGAEIYGKTGSGRHGRNERLENPSKKRDGWFVGFIEKNNQQYIFVSNLTDKVDQTPNEKGSIEPYGSQVLKPITMGLLNEYFASPA